MFTGIFSTLLIPETKQRSLEELSNENQNGFVSGVAGKVEATRDGVIVDWSTKQHVHCPCVMVTKSYG
jgi:PHS family inorganic phosphate transporter-like MFS transporter